MKEKERWDGGLSAAQLDKLSPEIKKRILEAREEAFYDELLASESYSKRRPIFTRSVLDGE